MTILGPKLLSSDNREGFLGNTIDNIFWQVRVEAVCSVFHFPACVLLSSRSPQLWLRLAAHP